MRRRSLVHRVTALLSGALMLQLSLLSAGTPCHMHGSAGAAATANAAHSAHGGLPAHAPHVSTASESPASQSACDAMAPGTSCDAPWSPGGCASMSCAAISSMATPAAASLDAPTKALTRITASASMPLGPAFAPELPPPRA